MSGELLVHSCDGCGGTLLLDPSWESRLRYADSHFGVYTLCRSCEEKEVKREAKVVVQPGTRCTHRMYQGGPFSELVVTAVDGEFVTVAPIGLVGETPERARKLLHRTWPLFLLDNQPEDRLVFRRADLKMRGL